MGALDFEPIPVSVYKSGRPKRISHQDLTANSLLFLRSVHEASTGSLSASEQAVRVVSTEVETVDRDAATKLARIVLMSAASDRLAIIYINDESWVSSISYRLNDDEIKNEDEIQKDEEIDQERYLPSERYGQEAYLTNQPFQVFVDQMFAEVVKFTQASKQATQLNT